MKNLKLSFIHYQRLLNLLKNTNEVDDLKKVETSIEDAKNHIKKSYQIMSKVPEGSRPEYELTKEELIEANFFIYHNIITDETIYKSLNSTELAQDIPDPEIDELLKEFS